MHCIFHVWNVTKVYSAHSSSVYIYIYNAHILVCINALGLLYLKDPIYIKPNTNFYFSVKSVTLDIPIRDICRKTNTWENYCIYLFYLIWGIKKLYDKISKLLLIIIQKYVYIYVGQKYNKKNEKILFV